MRTCSSLIAFTVIILSSLFCNRAEAQDYSSYNIAKKFLGERDYLKAYKYMIIFEYSNMDRLQKIENAAALKNIEKQISQLEEYLTSNVSWYVIKISKGWTDQQVKDSTQNKASEIRLQHITIQ
jgi:hypothetical protein